MNILETRVNTNSLEKLLNVEENPCFEYEEDRKTKTAEDLNND
jgi:hypothetical protein